ncbi:MAG: hypothetical protein AB8C02_14220 [Halioglobus sp.]
MKVARVLRSRLLFSFLGSLFSCFLVSGAAQANPIIEGREWLQPSAVLGVSWNELNAVCGTGECAGTVGASDVDLSGWTWASIGQVGDLFSSITPLPSGATDYADGDFSFTTNLLATLGFDATFVFPVLPGVVSQEVTLLAGLSSTLDAASGEAFAGVIASGETSFLKGLEIAGTRISTGYLLDVGAGTLESIAAGGWFFRDVPNAVPTPGSFALVAVGIFLLLRRRCL